MTDEERSVMLAAALNACHACNGLWGECDFHMGYSDGLDAMHGAMQTEIAHLNAVIDDLKTARRRGGW